MQPGLLTFLKVLANKQELKNNQLAWIIATHFDKLNLSSKDKFYESIVPHYRQDPLWSSPTIFVDKDENEKEIETYFSKDYRIKSIALKNFRGYPSRQDGIPYGISFCENGNPMSSIIIGSNGAGKSSIYQAIEYMYCQRIGEAELRSSSDNIPDDSELFKEYATHENLDFKDVFCKIQTLAGDFDIHGQKMFSDIIKTKLNPNTHFISDFDIYDLGRLAYDKSGERSFHDLIANSLGLKEYLIFNKLSNQLSSYKRLKEIKDLNSKRDNRKKLEKDVMDWELELRSRKDKLLILESNQTANKNQNSVPEQVEMLNRLIQNEQNITLKHEDIINCFDSFSRAYNDYKSSGLESLNKKEAEFLAIGFELLETSTDCPFCLNSKTEINELRNKINARIKRIKDYSSSREKLRSQHESVLLTIREFYNVIEKIRKSIDSEINETKTIPFFTKVYSLDHHYFKKLYTDEVLELLGKLYELMNSSIPSEEGFTQLNNFSKELRFTLSDEFSNFFSIFNEFSTLRKQELDHLKILTNLPPLADSSTQKIILKKEIEDFESKINITKKSIETLDKEIITLENQYSIYESIKKDAYSYCRILNSEINNIVNASFDPINETISQILNDYLIEDNISIRIEKIVDDFDQDTGQVLSQIIIAKLQYKSKDISLYPNKYFNTFRYKLFSMVVGISVAIASRIQTMINIPLVLDDVFYASDFEKRTSIAGFIKKLISLFEKYTPSLPLQLIFFTHDEIIFDCALNAIGDLNKISETIFSRLFLFSEAEESKDFFDLTYRLPSELPKFITAELNPLKS